jgi:ADP-ribose pyrophosphatase YjhB (NUDIX family)
VAEETGVAAEIAGLLDIHEVVRRDGTGRLEAHYLLAVFFGRWLGGEPIAGGDAAAARFVPLDAVADLPATERAPEFIRRAWLQLDANT